VFNNYGASDCNPHEETSPLISSPGLSGVFPCPQLSICIADELLEQVSTVKRQKTIYVREAASG